MISRVVAVGPWDGHRIWVRFDDEVVGEIDLAEFLDLDSPLFRPLKDRQVFETVRVSPFGEVAWYIPGTEQGLDLCPDTLYMELTGLTEDEMAEKWGVKTPSRYRQWRRRRWANRGPLAKRWYRLKRRWLYGFPCSLGGHVGFRSGGCRRGSASRRCRSSVIVRRGPLIRLQDEQSSCRFSSASKPPFAFGTM